MVGRKGLEMGHEQPFAAGRINLCRAAWRAK